MQINQIKIRNFRNIEKIEYNPKSQLNIIKGKNAQGKTNLLEAIYMLSANNSFRTSRDRDLLNYNATDFSIRSKYIYQERNHNLFLDFDLESGKSLVLNNKKVNRSNTDLLKVVLFTPDDLYLVKGSPHKRRYFLDFVLKQITNDYNYCLDNFTKTLRKRNLLLRNEQTNTRSFKIVNDLYVEYASKLIILRLNFVALFDEIATSVFYKINDGANQLKIRYALSFPVNSDKINLDVLMNTLIKQLEDNSVLENRKRSTTAGPHLDDLHIYLDNKMARIFASQGQQRNIAITMKLAELYSFKKIKGFYPLFLLDEVLSELDNEKRQLIINQLSQADFQSFLTAVNLDNLILKNVEVDNITNGRLLGKE
ncbi:MAG TPA: DNA replication and repair protein RecF [Syntrophomonadaceae bacterium]|nr:DNA replication and repair protein RecF [Syntrophomonadaceae bacterium]